jgi:hypothetical protein
LPGSTVVVENKPGAGTMLAAAAVAQARPDGYTLFYSGNTTFTMNPALRAKVGYDPIRSYEPIGMIGTVALALIAHPSAPAKTLPELIALARSQPAKIVMASFGAGTSSHFVGELFKNQAGISMLHVPYKGSAPMMQDLVGGQIPFAVDTSLAAAPQAKGGRIKVLAVSSPAGGEPARCADFRRARASRIRPDRLGCTGRAARTACRRAQRAGQGAGQRRWPPRRCAKTCAGGCRRAGRTALGLRGPCQSRTAG